MRSRLTLIAAGVSVFVALGCSLAGTAASWFPVRTPTPVAGGAAHLGTPTPLPSPISTATPAVTPTEAPTETLAAAPAQARADSLTVVAGGRAALSAPGAPAGGDRVHVEAMDTVIRLTWTPVPSATAYTIYRDDSETPLGRIAATSYDDIGLTNGRTYSYTVAALDPAGNVLGRLQAAASPTGDAVPGR